MISKAVFYFLCSIVLTAALGARADSTVFAAASLRNALDEIGRSWSVRHGGKIVISAAASSTLARQIEQGAPADIYISADQAWMDYLERRKLIQGSTRVNLLRNELVMVAPASAQMTVVLDRGLQLDRLLGKGRLAMADPAHVPAGKYGKAALKALGLWPQVQARLIRAENVRTVLSFVARGEAPLGIVYRTDAAAEPKVRSVAVFPTSSHPPIVYPAALIASSHGKDAAAFLEYLQSPASVAVFVRHGFLTYSRR